MTGPAIRPLEPADAARCAALHAQSFAPAWDEADLADQLARPDRMGHAAALRGTVQGFILSRVVAGEADVLTVAVDRRARRAGLGRALVTRHLLDLQNRGVEALFLEVGAGNEAARRLYERAGFTIVGRRSSYYPGGEDALVMRRGL